MLFVFLQPWLQPYEGRGLGSLLSTVLEGQVQNSNPSFSVASKMWKQAISRVFPLFFCSYNWCIPGHTP